MIELLKRFSGKYRVCMVAGPACKLIEVFFDLLTPLVIARMIDEGVGARDASSVLRYGALLIGMAAVGICFTLVCQKMAALASQGMGTDIRSALYANINRLGYAELDRFGTPSLITRITNDVNQVQLAVALGVRQLIRWPFLAVGSMVAALMIDLKLGLIFLVSTPLIGVMFWLVMARCVPYFKQMQLKLDRIGLICREGLEGVRPIRAFVREDHERERFRAAASDQAATAIAVGRLSSSLNPVTFLVMNLAVCAILWMGGIQVNVGALTQGQVMAFVNYMTQTLLSIVYVANLVVVFTKASASAARVNEVLNVEPGITDEGNEPFDFAGLARLASCGNAEEMAADEHGEVEPGEGVELGEEVERGLAEFGDAQNEALVNAGAIGADAAAGIAAAQAATATALPPALEFDGASFAFGEGAAPAVSEVSLALPCGGTLGVIGGTGSGKSTLVSLLARLYDVNAGAVCVLGRDVRTWRLAELRRAVSMVPQKAMLVSGTIRSNLCWRNADATDAELWSALECAQAAEFVRKLPEGLDASVEAAGKNFSGGQRQRLTIARALVGEPLVLVLDDSASALDLKTDAALRHAIRERPASAAASAPLSTVIVSQRMSTVRDADLICVLSHGRVAGLGTHTELYRTCDIYREICLSQLKREELEGGGGGSGAAAAQADSAEPAASANDLATGNSATRREANSASAPAATAAPAPSPATPREVR